MDTQRFLHSTKVSLNNHSSSLSILHKIATIPELHHSLASLHSKNNMLGANHFYPIQRTENLFPTNPYIPASYLVEFISRLCIASLLVNSHTFRWLYVFRVLDNYSHIPLPHFPNSNPFPLYSHKLIIHRQALPLIQACFYQHLSPFPYFTTLSIDVYTTHPVPPVRYIMLTPSFLPCWRRQQYLLLTL